MNIEKNIYNIVNTVINTIHKDPYYTTEISNFNLDFKDIDKIWDYFKTISNDYKEKYKLHDDIVISDELIEIYKNNNILNDFYITYFK